MLSVTLCIAKLQACALSAEFLSFSPLPCTLEHRPGIAQRPHTTGGLVMLILKVVEPCDGLNKPSELPLNFAVTLYVPAVHAHNC